MLTPKKYLPLWLLLLLALCIPVAGLYAQTAQDPATQDPATQDPVTQDPTAPASAAQEAVTDRATPLQTQPNQSSQNAVKETFIREADRWDARLNQIETQIQEGINSQAQIEALQKIITDILADIKAAQEKANSALAPFQKQLDALGPPPADAAEESQDVRQKRERLNETILELQGQIQQVQLYATRANELQRSLVEASQSLATEQLMRKGPSPFSVNVWEKAFADALDVASKLAATPRQWWVEASPNEVGFLPYFWSLLAGIVTVYGSLLFRKWLSKRYGRSPEIEDPSYARAILSAAVEGITRGLIPFLAIGVIILVLAFTGLYTPAIEAIGKGILWGLGFFFIVGQLTRAAIAPDAPDWRIVPLSKQVSSRLGGLLQILITWIAVVIGLGFALDPYLPISDEATTILSFFVTAITSLLVLPLLARWFWVDFAGREKSSIEETPDAEPEANAEKEQGPKYLPWYIQLIRLFLLILLLSIPVASLFGYANLATYLSTSIINSGVVIGLGLMLRTMIKEAIYTNLVATEGPARVGSLLGLSLEGSKRLAFWIGALFDVTLFFLGLFVMLLAWGVPQSIITIWMQEFLQGVSVGGITFSPGGIFFAILLFIIVISISRFFQRVLTRRILPRTQLDVGVRHSLTAAANYTGIALAILVAISAPGLDLSNLAIIAGALSVGIGFGLQTIVNNFVSGLILLIERPVKVGDWINVGNFEGSVKKISVRSTEIETFDRSEVILPNSDLISSPVVNWTHKTRVARIKVSVGVAYGTDTAKVREILLQCAQEHPNVHKTMPITVLFRDFGDSSLDFQLRCFVSDTDYFLSTPSDIRFRIDELFRAQNIEIPFPQRDVHFRDLARLVKAFGKEDPEDNDGEVATTGEPTQTITSTQKSSDKDIQDTSNGSTNGEGDGGGSGS